MKTLMLLSVVLASLLFVSEAQAQIGQGWIVFSTEAASDTSYFLDYGWKTSDLPGGIKGRPSLDAHIFTFKKNVDALSPKLAEAATNRTVFETVTMGEETVDDLFDSIDMYRVEIASVRNGSQTLAKDPNVEFVTVFFKKLKINGGTPK